MPGGVLLADGEHTVGHIPVGAVIDGFQVWIDPSELMGANVAVSLGIPSNKTALVSASIVTDGSFIANSTTAPVQEYISNEALVATIRPTTAGFAEASATTTAVYAVSDKIVDVATGLVYDCILVNTVGILLTNTTYFTVDATATVKNAGGVINFNVDYTEVDTQAGKYTH